MRYLLLVYEDKEQWSALATGERDALVQACQDDVEALRASGYLLAVATLQSGGTGVTVRAHSATVSVTPGLAAQEQLRAIVTISAMDLNEAIQVAGMMPQARLGPIEVWPLREG